MDFGFGFALFGWLGGVGEFEVLGEFFNFGSFALLCFRYGLVMYVLYDFGVSGFLEGFYGVLVYLGGTVCGWSLMGLNKDEAWLTTIWKQFFIKTNRINWDHSICIHLS